MTTAKSYTDFHIDFGGTCVWYHVFSGEIAPLIKSCHNGGCPYRLDGHVMVGANG